MSMKECKSEESTIEFNVVVIKNNNNNNQQHCTHHVIKIPPKRAAAICHATIHEAVKLSYPYPYS